jgi:hypothetical protein
VWRPSPSHLSQGRRGWQPPPIGTQPLVSPIFFSFPFPFPFLFFFFFFLFFFFCFFVLCFEKKKLLSKIIEKLNQNAFKFFFLSETVFIYLNEFSDMDSTDNTFS